MTNFEKLGAVKQVAAEKLFHIIIEAHEAGGSPYENPAFSECVAIVQGVEIASTVAHKFDTALPSVSAGAVHDADDPSQDLTRGKSFRANHDEMAQASHARSSAPLGEGSSSEADEELLEGKSFQVNANTVKEGDKLEG